MDEMVYEALSKYFATLEKVGYVPYGDVYKLLVLNFYNDFVFNDYRGLITRDDYLLIERALNCLYGTTCLIPYPDYLKMGKLHLSEISEMACRVKKLEDAKVVKFLDPAKAESTEESDVSIVEAE